MTVSVPGESNGETNRGVVLPSGNAAFPRNARLLRHADFERVYKLGRRHFSASMTVFYWPRPETDKATAQARGAKAGAAESGAAKARAVKSPAASGLRIGFTVSRALGGAVQRNRMKRRLREAVRLTRPPAGTGADVVCADVVINPKKSLLTVDFTAVVNEVNRAFVVIEEKLGSGSRKPEAGSR